MHNIVLTKPSEICLSVTVMCLIRLIYFALHSKAKDI